MHAVRAKKHLGQHFLTDMTIASKIASGIIGHSAADLLEIGPGTGVLTQYLIGLQDINLTAVEIDHESVEFLHERFPELHLIEGDFLTLDPQRIFGDRSFSIIGNFPYNISSQIFFRSLQYKDRIPSIVCMLQKEVAQRLASPPGNKEYGILSVLLQAYYTIEYLFTVSEHVFNPPPKVKSGVIRLTRNQTEHLPCNEQLFVRVVKTGFNQRRKTLRNALKPLLGKAEESHPLLEKRAEQLSVADFTELTNWVESHLPTT
jgi:16S rRNA (adenine1518-N6/adenine1519-N6)-dimethyltransferase